MLGEMDVLTLHAAGLGEEEDEDVLRLAVGEGRTVLTHDTKTMPGAIKRLMASGETVPRLILVPQRMAVGGCG